MKKLNQSFITTNIVIFFYCMQKFIDYWYFTLIDKKSDASANCCNLIKELKNINKPYWVYFYARIRLLEKSFHVFN